MQVSFFRKLVLLVMIAILSLTGSPAFAAGPQDWIGTWNLFLSKAHPNTLPKTLVVSERGDCGAQDRWRCFSIVVRREGEPRFQGQIVDMNDRDRHAILEIRSTSGGGRIQYDAHIYVGRRLMSGAYRHIDAQAKVPVGYFTASRQR
jgi:hypothetical protein